MFGGCPSLWVSRLPTEIALSTTEAEYIALSQLMSDYFGKCAKAGTKNETHFFRHFVSDGTVKIKFIESENQLADIFTKGLPVIKFERL